jgi:hypothetical protein
MPGAVRLVPIVANATFGVASLIHAGVPLSCSETGKSQPPEA